MTATVLWRSYAAEFSGQPWRGLFVATGAGLVLVALAGRHEVLPVLCGSWVRLVASLGPSRAFNILIDARGVRALAFEWFAMLAAMMPLLLAQPIVHISKSNRPNRRVGAIASFMLGYACVWMLAGPVLMITAGLVVLVTGELAPFVVISLALLWSASPAHQVALNRGHRVRALAAFGWRADVDATAYGFVHGLWCSGACWAWMLMPLIFTRGHVIVMVAAGAVMFMERLAPPLMPRWRTPRTAVVVTSLLSGLRRQYLHG